MSWHKACFYFVGSSSQNSVHLLNYEVRPVKIEQHVNRNTHGHCPQHWFVGESSVRSLNHFKIEERQGGYYNCVNLEVNPARKEREKQQAWVYRLVDVSATHSVLEHQPASVWKNSTELHKEHHYAEVKGEIESPQWQIHQTVANHVVCEVLLAELRVDSTKSSDGIVTYMKKTCIKLSTNR